MAKLTREELQAYIAAAKIQAFDGIRMSRNIDIKHTGFKTYGDLAVSFIESAAKNIETEIQKWERENG